MRMSDCSSDVCSADLSGFGRGRMKPSLPSDLRNRGATSTASSAITMPRISQAQPGRPPALPELRLACDLPRLAATYIFYGACTSTRDRKTHVEGKEIVVRVDLGGRRLVQRKKN